ncbi:MAG: hypothetical protein HY291_21470 [Planctomycetes bacterium]|nr:hypothetical protein [Planctomycetota bacterium]
MSRSSIFNFESFAGFRPRMPWALLGVLAIVAALEAAARLVPNDVLIQPNSAWGQLRLVEREVIASSRAPQIVFLGSSRMRNAVVPRVVEERLGMPKGSVVNCALGGGRLFDALDLYRRNREILKGTKVVVIGLDDWYFTLGSHPLGTLYELDAPLSDRMRLPEPPRNAMVLDGLLQQRVKVPFALRYFAHVLLNGKPSEISVYVDEYGQVRDKGDEVKALTPAEIEHDAANLAYHHYSRFRQSPVLAGHLEELIRSIREDGAQALLVELPNRSAYRERVRQDHETEFQAHLALAREIAQRLDVPFLYYEQPEDCGLRDTLYADYGHLKPEGAHAFSAFFATELGARNLSGLPGAK